MHRWEKRLRDLSSILGNCGDSYFDPNQFRLNSNHFLTTARTVSFLIQKEKENIPDFQSWYDANVIKPWGDDSIMRWAKDSRNHIEKEGDLDLHSKLQVTLIYSYDEREDIVVACDQSHVLSANIKRLMRFSEKYLPTGIADASLLKIERRWIANTLPDHELLHAFIYVYARVYDACISLARHLNSMSHREIPEPTEFDQGQTDARHVRYVKFNERKHVAMRGKVITRNPNYIPPQWLIDLAGKEINVNQKGTLKQRVNFYAEMAHGTFSQFGNHVPMLWLFNEEHEAVDFLGIFPDDQATKFIFWRSVAERVLYTHAASIIWIAELWLRANVKSSNLPIRKLPITGERLHVIGLDASGAIEMVEWDIIREGNSTTLREVHEKREKTHTPYFLMPVMNAFKKLKENN